MVNYLGKVAKREVQGEAGGVDGPSPVDVGTGADEVVPVRVGEEAVAPAPGGGTPRVDGEGEPPGHVYRHPPPGSFPKLRIGPSLRPDRGHWSVGSQGWVEFSLMETQGGVRCVGLYARGMWEAGSRLLPSEGRVTG